MGKHIFFIWSKKNKNMVNENEKIFGLIDEIVKNDNLTREDVAEILNEAITKAYKKTFVDKNLNVIIDYDKKIFLLQDFLKVVDDKYFDDEGNDDNEIPLSEAKKIKSDAKIDDYIIKEISFKSFEPHTIRNALQLFKQKVSEKINDKIYNKWKDKKGTIISGKVETTDPIKNFSFVEFEGTKGFVSSADKIPGEILEIGKTYKFYVKDVKQQTKGWPIILSRSDAGFIKDLIKLEVPEVVQEIVTIEAISRFAGFKTKVAVKSNNPSIDPVMTCIGQRRSRIDAISREIDNREKIEFVKWYEDPIKFIASACSPSRILGVEIISVEEKSATIIVNKEFLSLIIGMKGQNIGLIAKLTGWSLDVKSRDDAERDNLKYTPIELGFYDNKKVNKNFVHQFASTNEILKNLETSESYEHFQNVFDLQDQEEDLKEQKIDTKNKTEENLIINEIANEINQEEPMDKIEEVEETPVIKETKIVENENRNAKVDYSKLKQEINNTQLNSLEAMLNDSSKPVEKKTKKNNYKKSNVNKDNSSKEKKKNVLDEFDDVTQDYLTSDEDNDYDDSDSYDEYMEEYEE